jgi:predicted  nucleic acid-binding Zn-ribbon protein
VKGRETVIKKLVKKAVKVVTGVASDVVGIAGDIVQAGVDVVAGAVKEVGKVVTRTARSVVKTVEKTVNEIGKAVESIGQMIQPLVERYAIQLALMYVGIPPNIAAPMSAGMHTIARGGSPEDAIKSAAVVTVTQNVQTSVYNSAVKAGYTAAQASAAASAAASAVTTASAGGDLSDVLKASAIGGIAGGAGTTVLQETKSLALANFTSSAIQSALQGQQLKEAILNGASAATVSYIQQIQTEQKRGNDVVAERDRAYSDYAKAVADYNSTLEKYNAATTQADVDALQIQLDTKLADINKRVESLGRLNQQIADVQAKVNDLTKKAEAETGQSLADFTQEAIAGAQTAEERLIAQIQEAAGREFGPATSEIQLAQYAGGPVRVDVSGVLPTIYVGDTVTINSAGIVFDKASGTVVGELTESQLFDLRKRLGLPTEAGAVGGADTMLGGTEGEIGTTAGGQSNVYGYMTGPMSGVTVASRLPTDVQFENPEVLDLMTQQQFFQEQVTKSRAEAQRLTNLREELAAGLDQVSPVNQPQIQEEIDRISNEINRLNDIANSAEQSQTTATENLNNLERQLSERTAAETEKTFGRIERQTAAEAERFRREQEAFDKELTALEEELATAETEAETAQARQQFVTSQRERLSRTGRLPGALQEQINAEINDLLDQYEGARERAASATTRREGLVAPQQERPGGQGISDEDVIRLLGLGEEEAARYGFERGAGGTGAGGGGTDVGAGVATEEAPPTEEARPEGEMELGGGEGEGTPTEGMVGGRGIISRVTIPGMRTREGGETVQTVSPRVTGEALVGILGEKEPLFGGDEDEQRAVWNRRSLRLRRALGL